MSAPEKWGPRDCPRCAGAPWLRDELCPGCEEAVAASEPAGPFPQEPAPGSAEAVERAAETIRGFTPGPWEVSGLAVLALVGSSYLVVAEMEPGPNGQTPRSWPSNARLIAAAPDLLRERDELRAEVERLRADLEESEHCLNNGGLYLGEQAIRADKLEAQRDALADALRAYVRSGSCYSGGFHPKEHSCRHCHGLAALRLAGRLP